MKDLTSKDKSCFSCESYIEGSDWEFNSYCKISTGKKFPLIDRCDHYKTTENARTE